MDNIISISNNVTYRIGDCILYDNQLFEGILRNPEMFDKTFLYTYCLYIRPHIYKARFSIPKGKTLDTEFKIQTAAKIAADFIRSRRFKIPPTNSLVLHLRLGDCYSTDPNKIDVNYAKGLIPNKNNLLNAIKNYKGKKIIIVTAYNNHTDKESDITYNNNMSRVFLDNLINSIPKNYDVSIRSSTNIDADFIYLCAAKNLLLSSPSLFGKLAQKIGIILHKIAH
jgi:hypothetical protein